jgi:hypothetical protein
VRYLVALDDVEEAREIENIASFEIDFLKDVPDQPIVTVAGVNHRPLTLAHELTARFCADHAHAAGDQDLHALRPQ